MMATTAQRIENHEPGFIVHFLLIYFIKCFSYNPIGNQIGACPPTDWRSPPVIDIYNRITERLCKEFKIPLIDTKYIIGVMWDRAADWCHYNDISGEMEARYILNMVLA
jgi:hypothetical protein